jgi:hypothetical protein
MLRILLALQHNMTGLSGKTKTETLAFYMKLIALLADECTQWLKEEEQ